MRLRSSKVVPLLVSVALVAAACGDDEEEPASDDAAEEPARPDNMPLRDRRAPSGS